MEMMARALGRPAPDTAVTFDIVRDRGDLHLGLKGPGVLDCTHFCYAPRVFGAVFGRVVAALLGEQQPGAPTTWT